MKKVIKEGYLFIILFTILLLKEPIYKLIKINNNIYNSLRCSIIDEEYNKLLEFNEIDINFNKEYINTYIIYKDIYNYMNEITIRGGSDKDFKKYPVIYDNILVGVIDKVNKNDSIVKLITNNDSKISVKINDEIGVLEVNKGRLEVNNISNYSNINIGDYIYTSGLGNINENFLIGKVKEILYDKNNIEKKIVVDYKLKIKDIDYVTVIKVDI